DRSDAGRAEAGQAGREVRGGDGAAAVACSAVLKRAIRTLWIMLDEMGRMWIPVERSWRLNERHYGARQGLNKAETAARHGEDQVKIWRRSYDIAPPTLASDDPRHPRFDPRYAGVDPRELPSTESLADTLSRVLPLWHARIAPELRSGASVLVVAHGHRLRALAKMVDRILQPELLQ